MQDARHNSVQNRAYGAPQNYAPHTIQNDSNQTTPSSSGCMTELLHGSLGDTRFSDHGYQYRATSRSTQDQGLYVPERSQHFRAQSELSSQSPSLWSPFEQHNDSIEAQSRSYTPDFIGSAPMRSKVSLRNATQQDLLAAQNAAYMQLYTENIGINARLAELQKAYATLATGPRATHNVVTDEIQDTVPLDPDDYPAIKYWRKREHRKERNRREEFKAGGEPRRRGRKPKSECDDENVNFWHFQHDDGTEMGGEDLGKVRAETKRIWRTLCDKYGPIGSPWSTVSPKHQLEFYLKIEAKFPLLRLCENHYKAESIAFSDYSHWYNIQYPPNSEPDAKPSQPRKRSRTASPTKSRKVRLAKRTRRVQESDQESGEELDDDAKDDNDEDENPDSEAKPDAAGDDNDDPLYHDLPFSPPRRLSLRASSAHSSTHRKYQSVPSSINSPTKPKPKPRPLRAAANSKETRATREDVASVRSRSPNRPSPAASRHASQTAEGTIPEAPAFNPNPLADITRNAPTPDHAASVSTTGGKESAHQPDAGSNNSNSLTPPPVTGSDAPDPDPSSGKDDIGAAPQSTSEGNNGNASTTTTADSIYESACTPLNDNAPRSTSPTTHTPTPEPWGGISDIAAGSVAGSTTSVNTSVNTKKRLMRPGTSKTARNLFAIDYCKDHIVTCEEFAKVWINMATEEKEVYRRREEEAKPKKKAKSA